MIRTLLKGVIFFLILIIILLAIAVYVVNRPTHYEGNHVKTSGHTATIILIDGLDQRRFQQALATQRLPHIQQLIDDGLYVRNGIGSFPSMTGYAFYPFITGHDAVESGIIGLRWFDRSRDEGNLRNYVGRTNVWMNQDITDTIPTYFELSGDQYTASINSFMNRGVADARITGWTHTTAKFEGKSFVGPLRSIPIAGPQLAKDHYQHESQVIEMAKDQLSKNPKVQWIALPSPDATFHIDGMTDNYDRLVQHIDSLIGDLRMEIDRLGQSETRMIAIVTDHGVAEVHENIDFLAEAKSSTGLDLIRGNAVNYRSMQLSEPLEDYMTKDGYFVINGNLCAMLYLRDPDTSGPPSWRANLPYEQLISYPGANAKINVPSQIAHIEGVELVIYRKSSSEIIIENQAGRASIITEGSTYRYVPQTADPLEYREISVIDTSMTADEWIKHTIHTTYPDAIYRIARLMDHPDVGDIVMTSKIGYDFARDYEVIVGNYRGGHGGLEAGQLRVPYVIYQPQGEHRTVEYLRSEDVGVLIGRWLGFK